MGYAFLGSVAGGSASPFTTGTLDTSGASLLVAAIAGGGSTPTLTDSKSNTWTPLTQQNIGGGASIMLFYAKSPTVGTGHTFSPATGANMSAEILAFSGADLTAPFDQQNGAIVSGSTTGQPGSITPGADNELVVSAAGIIQDGTILSVNSGYSTVIQQSYLAGTYYGSGTAYLIQTAATATNPTWTASVAGGINTVVIASFKAGAATTTVFVGRPPGSSRPFPFKPGGPAYR